MSSLQQQLFAANFMLQGVRALSFDLPTSIVLDQFAPTPPGTQCGNLKNIRPLRFFVKLIFSHQ